MLDEFVPGQFDISSFKAISYGGAPGYWNNPEASAEALRGGWLHTGDIGMFDDEGELFLLDRAKDMIISGGNNVYPREVEEIIVQHPAVANVCVVGIPDPYWGEAVHAVVVTEPGAQVTAQELIAHCGQHLAGYKKPKALGADVIKIERSPAGDDTRALPPRWGNEATVFLAMNRNKRSVLLDIKSPAGRDAILSLAKTADVVIESFPPGVAEKLGLTPAAFAASNPAIVTCTVSAFGDGPLGSTMPGYDALVQAVSGLMSLTGHPNSDPVRTGPSILDVSTGLWSVIAIQAALARRAAGAGGTHVQASLIESAFSLVAHQVQGFLASGEQPPKLGSGAPSAAPYRVYRTNDAHVMTRRHQSPSFHGSARHSALNRSRRTRATRSWPRGSPTAKRSIPQSRRQR